ncbi:protein ATP1B4 [Ambystoma mexicanum]|uniref:protein ATP1B4 n=1 Tax=Ambystoma mexicanum TaxID=8296 RepID=UPI0037E70DCD
MEKNSFACGSDDHRANSLQIPEHKDADSQLSLEEEEDESEDRKKKSKKTWGEIAQDAKTFMWNPKTRQFMGRTARSWAYILLFYIIFYIFLAGMFSFCMYAMLLTISPYVPTYGDRVYPPGVMVKPYFSGFRFAFNASERSTWLSHVENMHRYLGAYNDSIQTSKNIECTPGKYFNQPGKEDEPKKACQFKRSLLQNCSGIEDPTFGYSLGQPCLFLKMNRIVGYEAGEGTPIYVTCEAPKGEEGDLNSVSLYPENGTFALMYYPFYGKLTHVNYTSPLVAVHFTDVKKNHPVMIQCKLNGRGIINNSNTDRFLGRIIFTLEIGI